jgi:hypothetical protein
MTIAGSNLSASPSMWNGHHRAGKTTNCLEGRSRMDAGKDRDKEHGTII